MRSTQLWISNLSFSSVCVGVGHMSLSRHFLSDLHNAMLCCALLWNDLCSRFNVLNPSVIDELDGKWIYWACMLCSALELIWIWIYWFCPESKCDRGTRWEMNYARPAVLCSAMLWDLPDVVGPALLCSALERPLHNAIEQLKQPFPQWRSMLFVNNVHCFLGDIHDRRVLHAWQWQGRPQTLWTDAAFWYEPRSCHFTLCLISMLPFWSTGWGQSILWFHGRNSIYVNFCLNSHK